MGIHDKLRRVRKPRVHITYDVENRGNRSKERVTFCNRDNCVIFSGHNKTNLKPLKDRRFVQIDRDNFDDVLSRMNPTLDIAVDNTLSEDDTDLKVGLSFNSLSDF